jgi:hypothetical protein
MFRQGPAGVKAGEETRFFPSPIFKLRAEGSTTIDETDKMRYLLAFGEACQLGSDFRALDLFGASIDREDFQSAYSGQDQAEIALPASDIDDSFYLIGFANMLDISSRHTDLGELFGYHATGHLLWKYDNLHFLGQDYLIPTKTDVSHFLKPSRQAFGPTL